MTIRRTAIAGVALGLLTLALAQVPGARAQPSSSLLRYPYLTDLVEKSVTVNWATDRSQSTGSVKWGTVNGSSCSPSTSVTATRSSISVGTVGEYQWSATITLPSSASTYCYRTYLGSTNLQGSDPIPRFKPQVSTSSSSPFSFAVFGDWGTVDASGKQPDQTNLMFQIAASGARFAVTTGDNAYPSGSQINYGDLAQKGANTSAVFGPGGWPVAGRSIPIFPALGNHGLGRGDAVNPALTIWPEAKAVSGSGGRSRMDTYCCQNSTQSASEPSVWYAFNAGNARFYVLDAAWDDGNVGTADGYKNDFDYHWKTTAAEYQWLKGDLAAHPSQLKFAFFHYSFNADNTTEGTDPNLLGASSLEGLLSSKNVKMVFNGHAHMYQRNSLGTSGIVDYVTGGGGAVLQPIGPCSMLDAYGIGWSPTGNQGSACGSASAPSSASRVYHFLLVTVAGDTVTVTPTDSTGRTFDARTYDFSGSGPPPPSPPTAIFSDGFETGNLSLWTSTSGLSVQSSVVHRGTHAARGITTNGATYAKRTLPATYATGYARTWFNVASSSSQVNLLRTRTSSDGSLDYVFVSATGQLGLRNDVAGTTTMSSTVVPPGSGWHSVELRTTVGASGTTQVWLDGSLVSSLSLTANLGTTNIGRVQIGEVYTGRTYNVAFDDVAFDTSRVGA